MLLATLVFITLPFVASSQEAPDRERELADLIDARSSAIADLEKEIAGYQEQLKSIDGDKKTLQNQIKSLDITRKKLVADLSITENKITRTNLQLENLALDINDKEVRISTSRRAVAAGLRVVNEHDERTFVESLLSSQNLSDAWEDVETIQNVQMGIQQRIAALGEIKTDLEDRQDESTRIKDELIRLKSNLSGQKKVIEYNTKEKNSLLTTTKNSEANYQKLLNEKVALRDAFEKELLGFESELKLLKDPSSIPTPQQGILSWPLNSIRITQYFGNTTFAKNNPQVYNGNGHNGIDLAASVGTPIKAARDGEVTATGDTDAVCPGASYGKWILIEHDNGLSTLYAHLSVISLSKGDAVGQGLTVGYSGNTGYSTGPHLHFTVYATQGLIVANRKSRVCGGTYTMPIADLRAYLNPIPYLPALP